MYIGGNYLLEDTETYNECTNIFFVLYKDFGEVRHWYFYVVFMGVNENRTIAVIVDNDDA